MIGEIIDKVIQGEVPSSEERNTLLDFFAKLESTNTDVNRDVTASLGTLFPRLSDISAIMGTVIAGEFRTGNFKTPGDGFTGGRFGYPGFTYAGGTYFLAGVENDVLQVGLSLTDGTIKAGAGDVTIDGDGIWITNQQAAFGFEDTGGNRFNLYIYSDGNDAIGIINSLAGKAILQTIKLTDATTPYMKLYEDPSNANTVKLEVNAGQTSTRVAIGGTNTAGIMLWANKDGTETVFNDLSYDIDFRIESATNADFFKIDAGAETLTINATTATVNGTVSLDGAVEINASNADKDFVVHGDTQDYVFSINAGLNRAEFGTTAEAVHIIDPTSTTYFNEPGNDLDVIFRGNTDSNLLYIDAGADSIGIGDATPDYKLDVEGDVNVGSGFHFRMAGAALRDIFSPYNGWLEQTVTWTRTGNHTFTIGGDVRTNYYKGVKVRYTDGGSSEYGVIASVTYSAPDTTVNLIPNTDYAMAAATIANTYISYMENPSGFPHWFNFDAAPTGFSSVPSSPVYRWTTKANTIFISYVEPNNGTSNATTFGATAAIAPIQNVTGVAGTLVDNGTLRTVAGRVTMNAGSTAITFRTDMGTGAWTNANGKRAVAEWFYEF